jgi:phosphoglycolate phosphatase-like HAD superfamily hydrolase
VTPVALTLDLDDTLWPIWPAIERAEAHLHAWLVQRAPATAGRFDTAGLRALRDDVARTHPHWAHDLSAVRLESLRRALAQAGDDERLAEEAFEAFLHWRHRVDVYDDVVPALERLASRYPIVALTNGNADLQAIGLAPWFRGVVSARAFGVGKPDPRIFLRPPGCCTSATTWRWMCTRHWRRACRRPGWRARTSMPIPTALRRAPTMWCVICVNWPTASGPDRPSMGWRLKAWRS